MSNIIHRILAAFISKISDNLCYTLMKLKMPRIVETLINVGFLKIPNLAQMKTFAKFTLFQILYSVPFKNIQSIYLQLCY